MSKASPPSNEKQTLKHASKSHSASPQKTDRAPSQAEHAIHETRAYEPQTGPVYGDGLYQKILAVQQAMDAVPKRGYNSFHKYHYATEADILTVKDILNANRLVVLPTTLREETGFKPDGKSWASVTLLFRVIDVDTGQHIESQFTGYAEDNVDKAIYKATTGANKYFYLKFFGIATEDDPERDDAVAHPSRKPPFASTPRTTTPPASHSTSHLATPAQASQPIRPEQPTLPEEKATLSAEREATISPDASESRAALRNQALVMANKILTLQKQAHLSNEDVLRLGEIESIRDLAEMGNVEKLNSAYLKISYAVNLQPSS